MHLASYYSIFLTNLNKEGSRQITSAIVQLGQKITFCIFMKPPHNNSEQVERGDHRSSKGPRDGSSLSSCI